MKGHLPANSMERRFHVSATPVAKPMVAVAAALTLLPALAGIFALGVPAPGSGEDRHFDIVSYQWGFSPARIEVNLGDRVTITVYSKDVSHGIFIDGYEEALYIPGGGQSKNVTMQFTADKVGKFKMRCSIICGNYHPYMLGELVVKPNAVFVLAVGVVVAVPAVLIWKEYMKVKAKSGKSVKVGRR